MEILKYMFFSTSEDFEVWQMEEERKIYQITPIVQGMDIDINRSYSSGKMLIGCFVAYIYGEDFDK